jgi:N6-adenosine-specific RNA methylase IME4
MNIKCKKYQIIYADPPWSYKTYTKGSGNGNVLNHYETMSAVDIQKLKVKDIAERNSVLLMWATMPCLPQAIETMEWWGFSYKTVAFVWVKKNKKSIHTNFWGLGHYTRANAELLLLGTKGTGLPRISKSIHQIIETPIEQHSKKPDIVRDKIVQLFGNVTKIELFARQSVESWDSWGNEIKSDINL